MEKTIKTVLLENNQILISQIDEVPASVPGEPDCKLTKPFVLVEGGMLESWMQGATRNEFNKISTNKNITNTGPTPTLVEKYEDLIK